jgi:hypothetical protein
VTSIQVLSTDNELVGDIQAYDKRSANREQAYMGDYYIPRLEAKAIPSLLVGWDFPLNPRQLGETGSVGPATAEYIWDQTILQTTTGLTVTYGVNAKTNGIELNHDIADASYALIQYLDEEQAQKFVGTRLSVNINGYTADGSGGAGTAKTTSVQVKIFANAASNQFGTLPTSLVDIATATGVATLTGTAVGNGWYEIPRSNLPTATGELVDLAADGTIAEDNDIGFSGWVINDNTQVGAGVKGIAVVVSLVPEATFADYETQIDSISVVPGDIPTRPAPLSYEETVKRCQYYYEQTYEFGTAAGTVTDVGMLIRYQPVEPMDNPSAIRNARASAFEYQFKTIKRVTPTLRYYSPAFNLPGYFQGVVSNGTFDLDASQDSIFNTYYTPLYVNREGAAYKNNGVTTSISGGTVPRASNGLAGSCRFHYTADSRIGV